LARSVPLPRRASRDPSRHLAWIATRLRVPAERIAASAAWRSYPGQGDSLDLIELLFVLERELDVREGGLGQPARRLRVRPDAAI